MPDAGQISASELIGMINRAGQGDVLTLYKLKQHRQDAGDRFYSDRLYSLPAYAAWLHDRHGKRVKNTLATQYETHKERMAERSRLKSMAAREIGEIPERQFPDLVESARGDLKLFCTAFLSGWFPKPFCQQQEDFIREIEKIAIDGGMQAIALPRHRGKSTITKAACLWATLYGHRRYVVWLAADDEKAGKANDGFWTVLRSNEAIVGGFPKICYPLVKGGADQRSKPLYQGRELQMGRKGMQIIFPDIEGSDGASAILEVGGLLTAIRGLTYDRPDGTIARPDFVVLDDPQTDEPLDIDTPILTPSGFVRMEDIAPGDRVFDENGCQCEVVGVSPVFYGRECHRVIFDDGSEVVTDARHKWTTSTALQRTNARRKVLCPSPSHSSRPQCQPKPFASVVTTEQIAETLTGEGGRNNHSIPMAGKIQLDEAELPIPPYTLGVWLGRDGDSASGRITTADPEILDAVRQDGFEIGARYRSFCESANRPSLATSQTIYGLKNTLRKCGLLKNKHLPNCYFFASASQRLAVLQGLMDTDGSVTSGFSRIKGTRCTFSNTNKRLIDAVHFLCRSLGIKATCRPIKKTAAMKAPGWTVNFITSIPVFRLSRKVEKLPLKTKPSVQRRYIVAVEPVHSRPVRCITVASKSHLFLCGEALIPTHNSALSDQQCDKRENIINQAVLGLSGPGVKIAAVMPCTIIRHGDLSSRILNRKLNPEWHGIIGKALETLPLRMDLWDRYNVLRVRSLDEFHDIHLATDFYQKNRDEMDRGVVATWLDDFEEDELSAVQHEMNEYYRDREYFFAERQNCPLQAWDSVEQLNRDDLIERTNKLPREIVPDDTTVITGFVDVHKDVLYWMVVAWRQNFSGQIAAYGTWPDQKSSYFDQRNVDFKIGMLPGFREKSLDTQLEMALVPLFQYLNQSWTTESGDVVPMRLSLIDANWHESTSVVHKFCSTSAWRGKVFPSHGRAIAAGQKPISAWKRQKKDHFGPDWTIPIEKNDHPCRHVVFDANAWKSNVASFLLAAPDGAASLSFHEPIQQYDHRLLVDHLVSEKRAVKIGPYRTADVWALPDNRPDNHWFDCLVGCAVAASICGLRIPQLKAAHAEPTKKKPRRSRVHYGEWQA